MAKGRKTGGRQKGSKNKADLKREAEIAASGLTPMDFLLGIVRDAKQALAYRVDAAKAVAPYVHPKLSSVQISTPPGQPLEHRHVVAEPELIGAYFSRITKSNKPAASGRPDPDPRPDPDLGDDGQGRDRPRGRKGTVSS